jgi:phosphopantothenoylcysteine decarboxylase/phosphopantothenate--cysteine ligase
MLANKNIILGVTGGIAAYKAANLTRLFVKKGANVKIIMTPLAKEFITPLTLATLSKNPILVDFFNPENGDWNSHIDLGLWADAMVIAPATANTMGKMAHGIADNLLLTTYLSARCPVFLAPSMDLDMYQHPATTENMNILTKSGNYLIDPETGELASGLIGKGRMAEPETIAEYLETYFNKKDDFQGKNILITAGPTLEMIDPVRFIGNHSSGKMGYALAEELAERGALITLVSGPVSISPQHKNIQLIRVTSAQQMHDACIENFDEQHAAIMVAAVADYSPITVSDEKIKKDNKKITLELKETTDIAAALGNRKTAMQILVGFALETNNEIENASQKLKNKNFDFIVLNSLKEEGSGFQTDTNKIIIITKQQEIKPFETKSKKLVAKDIADELLAAFNGLK